MIITTTTTTTKKTNNYAKIILVLSLNWAVIKYSNSDATFSNIAKLTRNQTFSFYETSKNDQHLSLKH